MKIFPKEVFVFRETRIVGGDLEIGVGILSGLERYGGIWLLKGTGNLFGHMEGGVSLLRKVGPEV